MTPRHHFLTARQTMRACVLALAVGVVPAVALPTSAADAAPYCGITWGSLDKASGGLTTNASITDVRSGKHACYDRLVVDVRGRLMGYAVTYANTVLAEGSGLPVACVGVPGSRSSSRPRPTTSAPERRLMRLPMSTS